MQVGIDLTIVRQELLAAKEIIEGWVDGLGTGGPFSEETASMFRGELSFIADKLYSLADRTFPGD